MTGETPLLVSPRRFRNLWQSYRVFPDRVELACWLVLHTFVIAADAVETVEALPATLSLESFKNPRRCVFRSSLKLDLSDFFPHVLLRRTSGLFRNLRFTPDDPGAFAAAIEKIKRAPARKPASLEPR
ncbi:MAG: hypothetical protein AB1921_10405 [Thermodesulfobacteriota bacterium]